MNRSGRLACDACRRRRPSGFSVGDAGNPPVMPSARITVHRRSQAWINRHASYKIVLDDKHAGRLKRDQTISFEASPGHHTVQATVDWCQSPPLGVTLADGEEIHLDCRTLARPLSALYWMTLGRRRYLKLDPAARAGDARQSQRRSAVAGPTGVIGVVQTRGIVRPGASSEWPAVHVDPGSADAGFGDRRSADWDTCIATLPPVPLPARRRGAWLLDPGQSSRRSCIATRGHRSSPSAASCVRSSRRPRVS
jgi:hypothetical protein